MIIFAISFFSVSLLEPGVNPEFIVIVIERNIIPLLFLSRSFRFFQCRMAQKDLECIYEVYPVMILFLYLWFCFLSLYFITLLIFGPDPSGLSSFLYPVFTAFIFILDMFLQYHFF